MEEGQAVGILSGAQGGFVHETADGEMRQHQSIELLPYQIRRLTAQDDMRPPQMSLEFVEQQGDIMPINIGRMKSRSTTGFTP